MAVLRRDLVPAKVLEPWVTRVAVHASGHGVAPAGGAVRHDRERRRFVDAAHARSQAPLAWQVDDTLDPHRHGRMARRCC